MEHPLMLFLSSVGAFYCYSCTVHIQSLESSCSLKVDHSDNDDIKAVVEDAGLDNVSYDYPPLLNVQSSLIRSLALDTIVSTVYNSFAAAAQRPRFWRELLIMGDGATVGLDWLEMDGADGSRNDNATTSLVLLHHGLCGSSASPYITSTILRLKRAGYNKVCVFIARGCGGVPLTTSRTFNASRISDMEEVLRYVSRNGRQKAFAIGYSLGAGVLLNYVGAAGANEQFLAGCVAISPAWNFHIKTTYFDTWSALCLVNALKVYVIRNLRHLLRLESSSSSGGGGGGVSKLSILRLLMSGNVASFDHHAIVEAWGDHPSVDDYYRCSSAVHRAANIYIPTLSISAENDPVCSHEGAPAERSEFGYGLIVAKARYGGHVTFPLRRLLTGESFADDLAARFIASIDKTRI